jgi:hypothetical protein
MPFFLSIVILFSLPLVLRSEGVKLDEKPLLEMQFPLDNNEPTSGLPYTTIRYVLLPSGISYSQREGTWSRRGINRSWLTEAEIGSVREAISQLVYVTGDARVPRKATVILTGSIVGPSFRLVEWRKNGSAVMTILTLLERRDFPEDLQKHFASAINEQN